MSAATALPNNRSRGWADGVQGCCCGRWLSLTAGCVPWQACVVLRLFAAINVARRPHDRPLPGLSRHLPCPFLQYGLLAWQLICLCWLCVMAGTYTLWLFAAIVYGGVSPACDLCGHSYCPCCHPQDAEPALRVLSCSACWTLAVTLSTCPTAKVAQNLLTQPACLLLYMEPLNDAVIL